VVGLPPASPSAPCVLQGLVNQRRGRADSMSKILFQHLARTSPITLPDLLAATAAAAGAMEEDVQVGPACLPACPPRLPC
jgi:hypothetical protein